MISTRIPSEVRARRGASGGARRSQITTIATSARRPAPTKRGRFRSKPTMERQPFEHDDAQGDERDPRPDLELAAMEGMNRRGCVDRRQGETVGGLELGDLLGKEIDGEPRPVDLP